MNLILILRSVTANKSYTTFHIYLVLLSSILLAGCQTIPDTDKIIQKAEPVAHKLEIKDGESNLSQNEVDKALDKLVSSDDVALLEKQLKITQSISKQPLIADNETQLLFDGEQTFKAIFDAISSATTHINLEYFIFENIRYKDSSLQDVLLKKRNEGVAIHIIYDAFGSLNIDQSFLESLKGAGIKLTEFHSLDLENVDDINHRDHRKILIVDGRVAIVGGVNLSATYQSKTFFGSGASKDPKNPQEAYWRDTDLLIRGPAVAELQKLFLAHWDKEQPIDQSTFFPKLKQEGKELIQVIGSSPKDDKHYFYLSLVATITNATKEIILCSAYFVPTKDQKQELINAAKRGVAVALILPGLSDSTLSINVQRSHYEDLLKEGIDIYEMDSEVLHAKTIAIDGVWSVIGSSNFDYRSASLNEEVDVIVLGNSTAKQLDKKFDRDKQKSKKIELKEWQNRPLLQKIKESMSRILERLL